MESYPGLARKYRPRRLQSSGRIYEPHAEEPWQTTVRPEYAGDDPQGVGVIVDFQGRQRQRRLPIPALVSNLDAPVIFVAARELAAEIDPHWLDKLRLAAS